MRALYLIPARARSKRIEHKNMQSVGGMSLVERAIDEAVKARTGPVVVSSDDPDILGMVEAKRINGPWRGHVGALERPGVLCEDDTPMVKVVHHALLHMSEEFQAVVLLQPTTPQRDADTVARALEAFSTGRRALCTVNPDGRRNGGAYIVHPEHIGRDKLWRQMWIAYETPQWIDINTPEDLEAARRILGP